MHILPQLRKLEEQYPDEIVVVGVHSAKFTAEKETEALKQAVLRYDIRHPVVNDRDFAVWQQYAARAWPSLFFVNPEGMIIGKHEGEYRFEDLDSFVAPLLKEYEAAGTLQPRPKPWVLERDREAAAHDIAFPGKVLADPSSDTLYIADSGHNRVLVTSLDGEVQAVIGSGTPGLVDGDYDTAQFNDPQGIAAADGMLYVADKGNHALRCIDLAKKQVITLAGTGSVAMTRSASGNPRDTALRSPWDVEVVDNVLYIAMAGTHQLWSMDLKAATLSPFAGNGRESLSDGPLTEAELAQPTGIVNDGKCKLYFTDSETSSVRSADINPTGNVETLVGTGLFDFGDRDGVGDRVLLQHTQGLAYADGMIYIADSYNNKIKRVDPATKEVTTMFGSREEGTADGAWGDARLFEPSGVSVVGKHMYIADTNNHAIRVADLESGAVTTLEFKGL
jgi:DNA-binding beta-propeller fold protein YncE